MNKYKKLADDIIGGEEATDILQTEQEVKELGDRIQKQMEEFHEKLKKKGALKMDGLEYKVYKDGDKWCAVNQNFINLQVSLCGFGDNPVEALEQLIDKEVLEGTPEE